ncbi:MAG: glycosyltransferase family 4 protein [Promethearchaeota archaeon]
MKIAIIDDLIYPYFRGGAERRYYDLYNELGKKHEIHWFTMKFPEMKKSHFKYENINVHCVMKVPKEIYFHGRRKIIPTLIFAFRVFKEINHYKFDFIDSDEFPFWHNFLILLYSKFKKTPTFLTWMEVWKWSYWRKYLGNTGGTLGYVTQFLLAKLSNNNICISNITASNLSSLGVNKKNIRVIYGGINLRLLLKIKESVNSKKNQIISIGRLIPEKNFPLLINSIYPFLKNNESYKLIIIGEGTEKKRIIELINTLDMNDRIKLFSGRNPYNEIMKTVCESKVLVSLSHREGFGLTIVEAKALGVLVITNDHEENAGRFLIKNNFDGLIIKSDGSDLALTLQGILSSKEKNKMKEIIHNAFQDVKKFDYRELRKKLQELLNLVTEIQK